MTEAIKVKPLEWTIAGTKSSVSGGAHDTAWAWDAKGVGLNYRIITQPEAEKPYLLLLFENYATLDEAKAAAQADYEQRIMSALCPSSSSGGDAFSQIVAARKAVIDATAAYNARLAVVQAERDRGNWSMKVDPEYHAMSDAQSAFHRTVQDLADAALGVK